MGNKTGWILAGILVVVIIGVIIKIAMFPSVSGPTLEMLKSENSDFQDIKVPLGQIIGSEPSGGGNAADDYRQAAILAAQAIKNLPEGAQTLSAGTVDMLQKIDAQVAAGAGKKSCKYLFVHTPQKLEVGGEIREVTELQDAAGGLNMLAEHLVGKKDFDGAWRVMEHALVMGRHLMDERSHPQVVQMGLGIQRMAIDGFRTIRASGGTKPDHISTAVTNYALQLSNMERIYGAKYNLLWKVKPDAGNIFYVVERDKDRSWRVQGLLTLGLVKFTASQRGDRKHTESLLVRYRGDADPIVKAAADAAYTLTRGELQNMGNR